MLRIGITVTAALCIAACGGSSSSGLTGEDVGVTNAYIVKPAEGRDMTSGGLNAVAAGTEFTLMEVTTDSANRVELHTMEMNDGKMRMRRVESFSVTPDAPLTLERGGKHLMLFGVSEDLTIGETVEIELRFDDAAGTKHYIAVDADVIGQGQ